MAIDSKSLNIVAVEKLSETIKTMDDRWYEAIKEMRTEFKLYQEKTDIKLEKMNELLSKLVHIDTEVKENNKRIHHRIDDNEKNIEHITATRLNGGCTSFREHVAHMDGLNLDERLKTIEERGSKRVEVAIIETIKWATIIVLGLIGIKIGLTK